MLTANSKAISTVANAGIMQGDGNGKVKPNDVITRAEAATLVVNFVDTDITGEAKFTDTSNHWAAEAINRVAAAGWITGNGDDKLLPNDNITYTEVVAIFNRILNRANGDLQMLPQMITWPNNNSGDWWYNDSQEATNSHDFEQTESGEHWTRLWNK